MYYEVQCVRLGGRLKNLKVVMKKDCLAQKLSNDEI